LELPTRKMIKHSDDISLDSVDMQDCEDFIVKDDTFDQAGNYIFGEVV